MKMIFSTAVALSALASAAAANVHDHAALSDHDHHRRSTKSHTSHKRGLAYNDASLTSLFVGAPAFSWAYNWGAWTDALPSSQFEYVPMLWGASSTFTSGWNSAATGFLAANSTHLLSFNEPDYSGQANLSPAAAAAAYMTYMQPFAGKAKLGAPAVTNGPAPMGLAWLSEFLTACSACTIDFIPVHWYAPSSQTQDLKNHLTNASSLAGGKPVWLTEFGTTDGNEQAFLEDVMPWMDAQKFVHKYAYFMVSNGLLVSGNQLSSYGQTYKNYTASAK